MLREHVKAVVKHCNTQLGVGAPPPPPPALNGWHLTGVKLNWQHRPIHCLWPLISIHCGKQGFSQKKKKILSHCLKHSHQKIPHHLQSHSEKAPVITAWRSKRFVTWVLWHFRTFNSRFSLLVLHLKKGNMQPSTQSLSGNPGVLLPFEMHCQSSTLLDPEWCRKTNALFTGFPKQSVERLQLIHNSSCWTASSCQSALALLPLYSWSSVYELPYINKLVP